MLASWTERFAASARVPAGGRDSWGEADDSRRFGRTPITVIPKEKTGDKLRISRGVARLPADMAERLKVLRFDNDR